MTRRTERILWIVAWIGIIAALGITQLPLRKTTSRPSATLRSPQAVDTFDPEVLGRATDRTITRNPFRLDRRPSDLAFGSAVPADAPGAPPKPSLQGVSLKGIVGGPPWLAVLAGVPGRESNVVVRTGDTLAGLRVRRIQRDAVTLAGTDSLMTLPLQRTWQ